MNRIVALVTLALASGGLACASREHITETQGRSYTASFTQQAPTKKKITGPVTGLDSQEAAIISDSYRRSLAPKNVTTKEEPILVVQPQQQGGAGYGAVRLAPSVPPEK